MNPIVESLRTRYEQISARLESAANRTGRSRDEITLIAVSKYHPATFIREAYALGIRDFGENYVQEFEQKEPEIRHLTGAAFHLIGHLQSNKVRRAATAFTTIQTIDSARLALRLDAALTELGRTMDVMLEVKLSGEGAKTGARENDLEALIEAVRNCPRLSLVGLMTMPPYASDPEFSRPYFQRLRELAVSHNLSYLSMGMSHDFEIAVEEGATHIRIGTALFGPRA